MSHPNEAGDGTTPDAWHVNHDDREYDLYVEPSDTSELWNR